MSSLTQLSDAELDAVTGGFFNAVFGNLILQKNVSVTNQGQVNTSILPILSATGQGGSQNSVTQQQNSVSAS